MKKIIDETETMKQLGARKGHITRKRSKLFLSKLKKFLDENERPMVAFWRKRVKGEFHKNNPGNLKPCGGDRETESL